MQSCSVCYAVDEETRKKEDAKDLTEDEESEWYRSQEKDDAITGEGKNNGFFISAR